MSPMPHASDMLFTRPIILFTRPIIFIAAQVGAGIAQRRKLPGLGLVGADD